MADSKGGARSYAHFEILEFSEILFCSGNQILNCSPPWLHLLLSLVFTSMSMLISHASVDFFVLSFLRLCR